MKKHHQITKNESPMNDTLNLKKSLGIKVISKSGIVLGKLVELRMHPTKLYLEGILVSRGFLKKPFYIGKSYLKVLSKQSVILDIDPVLIFRGRRVIDSLGRKMGRVKRIERKDHSNELKELVVKSFLRKEFSIPLSKIKSFGVSIILQDNHNVKRKYFWQNS